MAITNPSLNTVFGARNTTANESREDLPQAEFWLNLGYEHGEGENTKFISLPVGIALDTMKRAAVRNQSDFSKQMAASNDLLDQVLAEAGKLEPGSSVLLPGECAGLRLQLRRRSDPNNAATGGDSNEYSRKLLFAEAAAPAGAGATGATAKGADASAK